jgi:inorganic pyrophosphatase
VTIGFWDFLDQIISETGIHVDRPKGSHHPIYPESIYPLDYGYLEGTRSGDREEIDVWTGTAEDHKLTGLVLTVDAHKRDVEIKLLLASTEQETQTILAFHNRDEMRAICYPRPKDDP